jgi:monoamine oxidase
MSVSSEPNAVNINSQSQYTASSSDNNDMVVVGDNDLQLNSNKESIVYDVIIIGGGLAGISAAYYMKKMRKNVNMLIVEARDRLGGRTQTVELKCSADGQKTTFDVGGQWICDTQTNITRLVKELGMETYTQYIKGTKVLEVNGRVVKYDSALPKISVAGLVDLQLAISRANLKSKTVNTLEPFRNAALAQQLDMTNLEQFMFENSFTASCKSIVTAAIRTVFGLELKEINALFGLMYVKSCLGIESLVLAEKDCAQEKKIKGGTQQISRRMLERVMAESNKSKNGDDLASILFNTQLDEIEQTETGVVVRAHSGVKQRYELKAKKVILAIPLNQYASVKFKPDLPIYKRNMLNSARMGNYMKFIVTYKENFWRRASYSGEVVSDGSIVFLSKENYEQEWNEKKFKNPYPSLGPIAIVYDGTTYDGWPALVGFSAAKQATEWLDQSVNLRRTEIIESLVRYFGDEARDYLEYFEKDWCSEPFSGGD